MKNEKKEFVILSDVVSMDEMHNSETLDKNTSNDDIAPAKKKKGKDKPVQSVKKADKVSASKDTDNKANKNKKDKKNKKKEKKEKLEALKAIKAINPGAKNTSVVSKETKHIETEKEKTEVNKLLEAEMNATMANIQEFMKSEAKIENTAEDKTENKKDTQLEAAAVGATVLTAATKTEEKPKSKKKKRNKKRANAKSNSEEQKTADIKDHDEHAEVTEKSEDVQNSKDVQSFPDSEKADKPSEPVINSEQSDAQNSLSSQSADEDSKKGDTASVSDQELEAQDEGSLQSEAAKRKSLKELLGDSKFLLKSLAVIVVLILYATVAYNYRDTFLMRTKINGIDCAGMTAQEAENALKEKVEDYELNISFRDGSTETIKGENINYKYISDGSVQKLKEKQISWLWLFRLIIPARYEVAEGIEFDRGLLAEEYYALESTSAENTIPPTNAYVTYEGDKFIVVPEEQGNEIDHHAFLLEINKVVETSGTSISATDFDLYSKPTIFSDSKDLAKECEQLNKLAVVSVTYTLANEEYVMDGNEVRTWLKVDENGNYSITEEEMEKAIKDYVDRLAKKVDTVGTERPFKATKQGDITVSGGTYGWKINKKEEIAKLTEEIANRSIVTREPCYSSRELTVDNNGFGDTYIEIDLTNQHLWYYIDGELHLESDLVSGTYTNKSRRTPGGIFLLTYKQKDRVLRGEQRPDGTYEYESPVSFWMPFNKGIGLHDATWRGSFGGTIYKYSGSHGCINLPYKKAQAIYEVIDKETPIICFY